MKKVAKQNFLTLIQKFIANTAIGPSALRGQGAKGVIRAARDFITQIDLRLFAMKDPIAFAKQLDEHTIRLQNAFPQNARNWGAARKAMNLFLRDAYYNQFLNHHYQLDRAELFMEIPLDGVIGRALISLDKGGKLPRWKGIKYLDQETSSIYQEFAKQVASSYGIARIHLDAILWTKGR